MKGDYAGQTFLVVNTDGVDGYQAGSDLVVRTDPGAPILQPLMAAGGGDLGSLANPADLHNHVLIG